MDTPGKLKIIFLASFGALFIAGIAAWATNSFSFFTTNLRNSKITTYQLEDTEIVETGEVDEVKAKVVNNQTTQTFTLTSVDTQQYSNTAYVLREGEQLAIYFTASLPAPPENEVFYQAWLKNSITGDMLPLKPLAKETTTTYAFGYEARVINYDTLLITLEEDNDAVAEEILLDGIISHN